jgi:hypothetical protein
LNIGWGVLLLVAVLGCSGSRRPTGELVVTTQAELTQGPSARFQLPPGPVTVEGELEALPDLDAGDGGLVGELELRVSSNGLADEQVQTLTSPLPEGAQAGDRWLGSVEAEVLPDTDTEVTLRLVKPGSHPSSNLFVATEVVSGPNIVFVSYEDPAPPGAPVLLSVLVDDPDGPPDGLSVSIEIDGALTSTLEEVGTSSDGALFQGTFTAPEQPGPYLLELFVTDADGLTTSELKPSSTRGPSGLEAPQFSVETNYCTFAVVGSLANVWSWSELWWVVPQICVDEQPRLLCTVCETPCSGARVTFIASDGTECLYSVNSTGAACRECSF